MSDNIKKKIDIIVNKANASATHSSSMPEGYTNVYDMGDADRRQAITDDLKADTYLKKRYANWFIGILIGQLIVMNGVFVAVGLKLIEYDGSTINLYMGGTLAEVFGIVFVITRHLFPGKKTTQPKAFSD